METPRKGVPTSQHGRDPGIGNGVAALVERLQALYVDELRQSLLPPVHATMDRRQIKAVIRAGANGEAGRIHPTRRNKFLALDTARSQSVSADGARVRVDEASRAACSAGR